MPDEFFIDYVNGSDSNTGLEPISNSYLTTAKFVANARNAGDIGTIRDNMTEVIGANINVASSGTSALPIILRVANTVNDPWNDGTALGSFLDFNGGAFRFSATTKHNWKVEGLKFLNSHDFFSPVFLTGCNSWLFDICQFIDSHHYGFTVGAQSSVDMVDCIFTGNSTENASRGSIAVDEGRLQCIRCSFDPTSTDRNGVSIVDLCSIYLEDCSFGNMASGVKYTINGLGQTVLVNPTFHASIDTPIDLAVVSPTYLRQQMFVKTDGWDYDGAVTDIGHQTVHQPTGEIDTDSTYAKSGGNADDGIRFQSNSVCSPDFPLHFRGYIQAPDGNANNFIMSVKFDATDTFASSLDETELYFTISELKADGSIAISEPGSMTWDETNSSTWQTMTISHTAAAAGPMIIDIYLKNSDIGTVYIDPPTESGVSVVYADGSFFTSAAAATGDAVEGDLIAGKTATVAAGPLTGTMVDRAGSGYTPAASAQTILAGFYNGTGQVGGDVYLLTGNIKSGITIFGVSGDANVVNTSTGDAVAGQILLGFKAWVDGVEITGTLEITGTAVAGDMRAGKTATTGAGLITGDLTDNGAASYDGGASDTPITDGIHLNSKVSGDSSLIAANIRLGATIYGVIGSVIESIAAATSGQLDALKSTTNRVLFAAVNPFMESITFTDAATSTDTTINVTINRDPFTIEIQHDGGMQTKRAEVVIPDGTVTGIVGISAPLVGDSVTFDSLTWLVGEVTRAAAPAAHLLRVGVVEVDEKSSEDYRINRGN